MKIETDNLRQQQFIFMDCLLQKALKSWGGGWQTHKKTRFLSAAKPAAVVLRLQVTRRVSGLSFHRCFRRAVTCYLYATCCLALCGLPAYIHKEKKRTHAASLSSLGKDTPCKFHDHSMLLLPILSL